MDNKIDIHQIAFDCTSKFEKEINDKGSSFRYKDTLYVSIDENNNLLISETPEILKKKEVCQCLMIHRYERKEMSIWYSWYTVQSICKNGCVHKEKLDEHFKLHIDYKSHFSDQWLHLKFDGRCIFSLKWPNEAKLQTVWNLYQKCKVCNTEREVQLLGELAKKDLSIFSLTSKVANLDYAKEFLKQERDMYKSLLDEIKNVIHGK